MQKKYNYKKYTVVFNMDDMKDAKLYWAIAHKSAKYKTSISFVIKNIIMGRTKWMKQQ